MGPKGPAADTEKRITRRLELLHSRLLEMILRSPRGKGRDEVKRALKQLSWESNGPRNLMRLDSIAQTAIGKDTHTKKLMRVPPATQKASKVVQECLRTSLQFRPVHMVFAQSGLAASLDRRPVQPARPAEADDPETGNGGTLTSGVRRRATVRETDTVTVSVGEAL